MNLGRFGIGVVYLSEVVGMGSRVCEFRGRGWLWS